MGICYSVSNDKIAIVERCGKFHKEATPGFQFAPLRLCCIDQVAGELSTRLGELTVNVETKTQDNVFVNITVAIQYEIIHKAVYEAFYKLQNPKEQITAYVFDVVRATVPKMTLDQVFLNKDTIAIAVKQDLKAAMDDFGWSILKTLVTDIQPDGKVKNAMNEINASVRMRKANREKAETEKLIIVKKAEGECNTMLLQGKGIARQRRAILDGFKDSVRDFSSGTGGAWRGREILDLILMTQYFDTLKELGGSSNSQTVFVPLNPGSLNSLAEEIKQGVLGKS